MSSPVAAAHHQHHHSVPFGVLPTHHSQLSHGFGLGFGFNAAQPQPPLLPLPLSVPVPSQEYHHQHSQQSQHSRRRRRSPSIDSSDDDNNQPAHSATASVKRTKLNSATSLSNQELSHTPQLSSTDLGKALASLPREGLLTLLTKLVTDHPQLRPTVESLLPKPTLTNTISALNSLERAVLQALPSGTFQREEYVWGRIRNPLEEYVTEAKTFLVAFCQPAPASSAASSITTPLPFNSNSTDEDIGHPSTTFAFLFALTSSIRRLELALPSSSSSSSSTPYPPPQSLFTSPFTSSSSARQPNVQQQQQSNSHTNPLSSHLLPQTINAWHHFLTRLSYSINNSGKVLSAGLVRGWFAKIDELCVESGPPLSSLSFSTPTTTTGTGTGQAKRACEGVRERMRKELGWLVGLRVVQNVASSEMMDEEEL